MDQGGDGCRPASLRDAWVWTIVTMGFSPPWAKAHGYPRASLRDCNFGWHCAALRDCDVGWFQAALRDWEFVCHRRELRQCDLSRNCYSKGATGAPSAVRSTRSFEIGTEKGEV